MDEPKRHTVELCSPPDREHLVAQILAGGEQWAEVNRESGALTVELYPRQDGQPWSFALDEAMAALEAAKRWLLERTGQP